MNRCKIWLILFFLLVINVPIYATVEDEITVKQQKCKQETAELAKVREQLKTAEQNLNKALTDFRAAQQEYNLKQQSFDKAKDVYTRAYQNFDLFTQEQQLVYLKTYQDADRELRNAMNQLKIAEKIKIEVENRLGQLKNDCETKQKGILLSQADIFDLYLSNPVWAEGQGEIVMDDNSTKSQCQKLAFDYALRDAAEKGGKAIITSLTKVEMFKSVKDQIIENVKTQIVEQDNSGEYGQVKQIIDGNTIKFKANVRVKLSSNNNYNPFREKLDEIDGIEDEIGGIKAEKENAELHEGKFENSFINLSSSAKRVLRVFGKPNKKEREVKESDTTMIYIDKWLYEKTEFTFKTVLTKNEPVPELPSNGSMTCITTSDEQYRSKKGIKVGDDIINVIQLYGVVDPGGGYYFCQTNNGLDYLVFEARNGKVVKIENTIYK